VIDYERFFERVRQILREELDKRAAPTGLISIREFAVRHSLAESTIRNAIREGRLVAERHGRAVRIAAGSKIAPRRASNSNVSGRADKILSLVRGGAK